MSLPRLRINPALSAGNAAQIYARDKLVQIGDFFEPDTAIAIAEMLRDEIPWRLVYTTPEEGVVQLATGDIQAMGQDAFRERMGRVMELATKNHGYCYNTYPMIEAALQGMDPGHPIHELTNFLNSREFLDFGAAVIGHPSITKADAQATLYARGSFLTRHVDEGMNKERRAAYTIGFSQNWQTDWGGLLMFLDPGTTDVTSAWLPRFNTLSLFDGMRVHSVSPVSAFAGDGRYSLTGWLRDDAVPA